MDIIFVCTVFQVSSDLQFKSELSKKNSSNELNLLAIENTVIIVPKWYMQIYIVLEHTTKSLVREKKKNKNMLCRVSIGDTRQDLLCRVSNVGHSAEILKTYFVECLSVGTRQRHVCRVLAIWHSTMTIFKLKKPLPSVRDLALGKEGK
jgi:hypothetical protein